MNHKLPACLFYVFCLLICISCLQTANERQHILKIYNWGDYIDERVLEEFPAWYKKQTGENIQVIYQIFDINEIMLTKIERGKEDFDLICPSDYIVERMLKKNLLLPIGKDFGQTPDYTVNIAPFIQHELSKIDQPDQKTSTYAVPYMWGTTGLLYNKQLVPQEDAESWSCLWNPRYKGKILMKDSYRDAYGSVIIYANREKLAKGEITVDSLMNDYSQSAIDTAEKYLKALKPMLAGWEADFGKEMMTKGKLSLNLTWSGDAQWAIEEAQKMNVDLGYSIPIEGSTIWYDCWAIPKYAKNTKAARYFINYLCQPGIAIRNMEAIGYVSAVASPEILEYAQDSTQEEFSDASYFFREIGKQIKVNPTMYPDRKIIEKCAMERDFGEETEKVLDMWTSVKGDNLNPWIISIIFLSIGFLLFLGIYNKYNQHHRQHNIRILKSRRK